MSRAPSERLVPEDHWVRWDLQDLRGLGIQDLQEIKAMWGSWVPEGTLGNQGRKVLWGKSKPLQETQD